MDKSLTQIQYFETTRDNLLASILTNDNHTFIRTFSMLSRKIKTCSTLSENSLKTLYQIKQIAEKFNKRDKSHGFLKNFLKTRAKEEIEKQPCIDYDTWKNSLGIDDKALKILFSTTMNFQLTTGCSNYCRRCNEWALPGVRKKFSFDAIIKIAENLGKYGNGKYALYSASDPLDWSHNGKDISHLMEAFKQKDIFFDFGLLTKVPRQKELVFKKILKQKIDVSVSITGLNRKRIERIEKQLSCEIEKQHDTDDLLIPAGRDENFSTIKSSITDSYGTEITPDGAFLVIPTFTSALNPTGQKRIPVGRDTKFFIEKMVGSEGLRFDYFQHLNVIDCTGEKQTLEYLLGPQIENLLLDNGNYAATPPGMISLKEYFETFKPHAVEKRKAMFKVVKKRLGAQFPHEQYLEKIRKYENLCSQEYMDEKIQQVFIYFLNSIKKYLKEQKTKRIIIRHLRRKEMARAEKAGYMTKFSNHQDIKKIIALPDSDTFNLFNQLVFMLLDNPDDPHINGIFSKNSFLDNGLTCKLL